MNVALVITPTTSERFARELLGAARLCHAERVDMWAFRDDFDGFSGLPVDQAKFVGSHGPILVERYLNALDILYRESQPDLILFPGNLFGDQLAARFGSSIGATTATRIRNISGDRHRVTYQRSVYGMQLEGRFEARSAPFVFSISDDCFPPVDGEGTPRTTWHSATLSHVNWYDNLVEQSYEDAKGIETFEVVLLAGRGIGSRENARRLSELAKSIGAGIGATRPVVLNGWLPPDRMVGLTGVVIKPRLCVTFGVSGCMPLVKGIEKSEFLVAINNDPQAPIFDYCDLGIVGDCVAAVGELEKLAGAC